MKTFKCACLTFLFLMAGCSAEEGETTTTTTGNTTTTSTTAATTSTTGGTPKYSVTELKLAEDAALHYINVTGVVARDTDAGSGAKATAKYYSDDYKTLMDSVERTIGAGIQAKGGRENLELTSYKVYAFPATSGVFKACVEFSAENSNYSTPTKVGCFEPKYTVSGLQLGKDSLNYAQVTGIVTRDSDYGSATQATLRYFSDEYVTLIVSDDSKIGEDIKTQGGQQNIKLSSYKAYLLPSSGGFSKVCVDFSAKNSNYAATAQLGA